MKIEDFLHLYIGCKCILIKSDNNYDVPPEGTHLILDPHLLMDCLHSEPRLGVKLILRPISDMTLAEWEYIAKEIFAFGGNEHHQQSDAFWSRQQFTDERLRFSTNLDDYNSPHYWQGFTDSHKKTFPPLSQIVLLINYCRKQSIDMDGLIKAGLAMDAKSLVNV